MDEIEDICECFLVASTPKPCREEIVSSKPLRKELYSDELAFSIARPPCKNSRDTVRIIIVDHEVNQPFSASHDRASRILSVL